jgi:hypothetical protein
MESGMTEQQIIEMIEKEIKWCKANPLIGHEEYCMGFIFGLKQIIKFIKLGKK